MNAPNYVEHTFWEHLANGNYTESENPVINWFADILSYIGKLIVEGKMKYIAAAIIILLAGCVLGYFTYRLGTQRDEKRMSKLYVKKSDDKKFRVKIRPVWRDDTEDDDTIIMFDLMAPDKAEAEIYAYTFLDDRCRSHSYDTIEVIEVSKEDL